MVNRKTIMRSNIVLALAAGIFSSASHAGADEMKNPFKGPYLGIDGGYATSSPTFESSPYTVNIAGEDIPLPGRSDDFDLSGFQGGAHIGYNFVTRHNFMLGIEGDVTFLGLKDTVESPVVQILSVPGAEPFDMSHRSELELEWQSTVRLRAGYVADRTLFYGTAGVAFMGLDWREQATSVNINGGGTVEVQNHHERDVVVGMAIGAGVEHAITRHLSIGADYLYENFGDSKSLPFGHGTAGQTGDLDDLDVHKISLRLTYRFGH